MLSPFVRLFRHAKITIVFSNPSAKYLLKSSQHVIYFLDCIKLLTETSKSVNPPSLAFMPANTNTQNHEAALENIFSPLEQKSLQKIPRMLQHRRIQTIKLDQCQGDDTGDIQKEETGVEGV